MTPSGDVYRNLELRYKTLKNEKFYIFRLFKCFTLHLLIHLTANKKFQIKILNLVKWAFKRIQTVPDGFKHDRVMTRTMSSLCIPCIFWASITAVVGTSIQLVVTS